MYLSQILHPLVTFLPLLSVFSVALAAERAGGDGERPLPPGAVLRMGSGKMWHKSWLTSVAFSPDDRSIVAGDYDGSVRIWDVATGQQRLELDEKAGGKVAVSPDGKTLATAGYYQPHITLWDAASGERIRQLPQNARSLAYSKDGRRLVAAGSDAMVRIWEPATGRMERQLKGHKSALYAVAISPDGSIVASGGGGDGTAPSHNEVRLWNVETGQEVGQLVEDQSQPRHLKGWVYALDFSSDGKLLAVASAYTVRIWDVAQRKQLHQLDKCTYDVDFSPVANQLVMPGEFGIYDATTAKQIVKLPGDVGVYGCVAISHGGTMVASGNKQGLVQLWDAKTGGELVRRHGHNSAVHGAAFSPDGTVVVSVCREDGSVRLWGTASGRQLRKIDMHWEGSDAWWSHEGSRVFFPAYGREFMTWTYDGTIRFWEVAGRANRTVHVGKRSVTDMALSPDGNSVAVVEFDGSTSEIGLYELDGGARLKSLQPFGQQRGSRLWTSCMAFSPNGKLLAVSLQLSNDSGRREEAGLFTLQLWDVDAGKLVRSFRQNTNPAGAIVFSPDGELLISTATGATPIQVWKVADGTELRRLEQRGAGHANSDLTPLAISPDGKILASATHKSEIVLWEVSTGTVIRQLQGHSKAITALAFSPDGKRLLSGSQDCTLLLWDIAGTLGKEGAPGVQLDDRQFEEKWTELGNSDGAVAGRAVAVLVAASESTTAFLRRRLRPAPARDLSQLPALIADLVGKDSAKRIRAADELRQFGSPAAPALYQALKDNPAEATRREVEAVLAVISEFPVAPDDLRRARAIQILEQIGTPEAEAVLRALTTTDHVSDSSREAQAALQRIKDRRRAPRSKVPGDQ